MLQLSKLSLLTLSWTALLATKVVGDELEGATSASIQTSPAAAPTKLSAAAPELTLVNYRLEVLMITAAVGLVANYFYGSRKNTVLASVWEKPITDVLQANFSAVGNGQQVLEWDSAADLLFYASGRRHCKYAQGHLMLTARQDPIALLNDLTANNYEKLQIEVTLNDDVPGFVFAAVPRKRSKAVGRDRYDVSTFAKVIASDKVPTDTV
ncbi:Coiled-coil domain-containing protein 47, partial [Coemansia brasiliensis]